MIDEIKEGETKLSIIPCEIYYGYNNECKRVVRVEILTSFKGMLWSVHKDLPQNPTERNVQDAISVCYYRVAQKAGCIKEG